MNKSSIPKNDNSKAYVSYLIFNINNTIFQNIISLM